MKGFNDFMDFRINMHLVPDAVALDVMVRISDWMFSEDERSLEDEYVKRQLRYASKFINKRTL